MEHDEVPQAGAKEPLLDAEGDYHDGPRKKRHSESNESVQSDHYRGVRPQERPLLSLAIVLIGSLVFSVFVGLTALWLGYHFGSRATSHHGRLGLAGSSDNSSLSISVDPMMPHNAIVFTNGTVYARPSSLRIVGLVFFGRRQFADILDCHLRRNLAVNGGLLDEVRYVMHTKDKEDQRWLEELVRDHSLESQYTFQYEQTDDEDWELFASGFRKIWSTMTDPDTIYVKIDDDMVFIHPQAIPEMVRTVIEHPEAHSVMANIVNNAFTYWHHHRGGATYPYLPEQSGPSRDKATSWRASKLPHYSGAFLDSTEKFLPLGNYQPPFEGHRWLPVKSSSSAEAMRHTPYWNTLPPATHINFSLGGWPVAAQTHYSFLENLEKGTLNKYHFGNEHDGLQNLWYSHYSINMMAIRGSNIALKHFWDEKAMPTAAEHGDEGLLTEYVPRQLNMPVLLATRAIAAHFAYGSDRKAMLQTDVLDRYRLYGNEMVCGVDNQKTAFTTLPE